MSSFEDVARLIVNQHYAAGPEDLTKAVAQALEEAHQNKARENGASRQQLMREVAELEKASERGSE